MIKVQASKRTVRETTADYEYTDDNGGLKIEQIRVRYFSSTLAELKQARLDALAAVKAVEDGDDIPWLSNLLAKRLESLPDLADEKGKPLPITVASLDTLTAINLRAINDAIDADIAPKSPPSS